MSLPKSINNSPFKNISQQSLNRLFISDFKLTDDAIYACQQLGIDQKDLFPIKPEQLIDEALTDNARKIQMVHFEQKRMLRINQVIRFLGSGYSSNQSGKRRNRNKHNFDSSIHQLSIPNEERIVKYYNSNLKGRDKASLVQKYKSMSVRPLSSPYIGIHQNDLSMNPSMMSNDIFDVSQQVDKLEKFNQRWQKVSQNKEKLYINYQTVINQKLDKKAKKEKDKLHKREESEEDQKGLKELKHQKYQSVIKKRETLEQEQQKKLSYKEQLLNQRIQASIENKKKREQDMFLSRYQGSTSKIQSEMNESQYAYKDRARTANKSRGTQNFTSSYFHNDEDDEEVEQKLQGFDQMFQHAYSQKQTKLQENVEKSAMLNEKLKIKQIIKNQRNQESEYTRLKYYVEKNYGFEKKNKKRQKELQEQQEMKFGHFNEQLDHKKAKQNEIQKNYYDRINQQQEKFQMKEQNMSNVKLAMNEFNNQQRELKQMKKQEQESNLDKHRRVQSAYKKILIDKLIEKEERLKLIQLRKQKIQEYRDKHKSTIRSYLVAKGNLNVKGLASNSDLNNQDLNDKDNQEIF